MTVSRLDQLYRRLLLTKFFTKGWGQPDNLKRLFAFRKILSNRETCQHLVSSDYTVNIDKEYKDGDCLILEGHFVSPFIHHLPGIMPKEVEIARFQAVLPVVWHHAKLKPVCIHLAGTGDHFFWRRRIFTARPLLKETGIASILLENPYYGTRKPKQQLRSSLQNVSDLFVMGGALVLESLVLLHWCERQGWGPLGLSGVSMGGHMASLAATNWNKPISLVPILSWSTASCVFTEGVMSGAIPWKTLQEQFFENSVYQDEIKQLIISPEDKHRAYNLGQLFVKDYSNNVLDLESMHQKLVKGPLDMVIPHQESSPKPADATVRKTSQSLSTKNSFSESPTGVHSSVDSDCSERLHLGPTLNQSSASIGTQQTFLSPEEYLARATSCLSPNVSDSVVHNKSNDALHSSSGNSDDASKPESNAVQPSFLQQCSPAEQRSPLFSAASSQLSSQQQTLSISTQQQSSASLSSLSSSSSSVIDSTLNPSKIPQQSDQFVKEDIKQDMSLVKTQKSSVSLLTDTSSLALQHTLSKARLMLPHLQASAASSSQEQVKHLQQEALDFMRGVMDECTHLGNFSVPVDPELIIIVSAKQDAYVPREGVIGLDQLWPGCEVRYLDQGHVGAVLFHQSEFRKAISDAFDRQAKKYYTTPLRDPDLHQSGVSS